MITLTMYSGRGYSQVESENTFANLEEVKRYLDNEFVYLVQYVDHASFYCPTDMYLEQYAQDAWDAMIGYEKTKRHKKAVLDQLKRSYDNNVEWFANLADYIVQRQQGLDKSKAEYESAKLAFEEEYNDQQ